MLVTGGSGQLAQALASLPAPFPGDGPGGMTRPRVVGRPAFDFDRPETLDALFADRAPTMLVNAAAYTAVDAAETDEAAAIRANTDGPARLAALCARHGTAFIHVSTDYVFDGTLGRPYTEADETNPQGVYGRTKRAGELAVLREHPGAVIVRTAWVYGPAGRNFCRTMLAAAARGVPLRVVADQRGTPTATTDLARAIHTIAARMGSEGAPRGIVHVTGAGETTWFGFAEAIFAAAAAHGRPKPSLSAIGTADWPTPARRPPDSRLDGGLGRSWGVRMPAWEESLPAIVAAVLGPEPGIAGGRPPGPRHAG